MDGNQELKLFEDDWGINDSPEDDTEIKMTLLYYSMPEYKEFKSLAKKIIKHHYGPRSFEDGNLSDVLLIIMRKQHEDIKAEKKDKAERG